jgi:aminoglycoside phosphotransferase (APT) family kinase protein
MLNQRGTAFASLSYSAPMAYVDLSQDTAAMRRIFLGLGLAGADEEVRASALTGGVSSGIYRVDLRSGRYCVKQALPQLKVAKEWKVPVERVFSEVGYLRTVDRIVPGHVPRVLGEDAATKSFVMPFLGPEYRNWKAEMLAGYVDPAVAHAVGDVLGRIHAATADDPEIAARFATDANFHAIRLEPYLVETARVHPALADSLLATVQRTADTRRVLVHGDVSPKNILLGPGGPVLLDAECAWFGDPAFDVAFCLNHFLLKAAHLPVHARTLLESFQAFADAYWPQVRWEDRSQLEARVATLLPGLTLARVDGKSPVEYLSEPARDAGSAHGVALLHESTPSLATIAARWGRTFSA